MSLDHVSDFLAGFQALLIELRAPVLQELHGPRLAGVVAQLAGKFLEQVRGVEAFAGREQQLEILWSAFHMSMTARRFFLILY